MEPKSRLRFRRLANVLRGSLVQKHILVAPRIVQVEIELFHRHQLHVYPEIFVVPQQVDAEIGGFLYRIHPRGRRLNEKVLRDTPRAFADEGPTVDPIVGVGIGVLEYFWKSSSS